MISTGVALADRLLNQGEWEKAEVILNELDTNPSTLRIQPMIASIWSACWMRLYSLTGRLRQAERLISEHNLLEIDQIKVHQEPELLALLEYDLATNNNERLLNVSEPFIKNLQEGGRIYRLIKALLFQTKAFIALGNKDQAILSLTQALSLGRLEGFMRSFVDAGEPVFKLLVEMTHLPLPPGDTGFDPVYIQELIQACIHNEAVPTGQLKTRPSTRTNKDTPPAVIDVPLTPPELSILRLLVAGYDNQEIASNQHLSINTVKTHISHIFGKLGVHNRVQASNRAKMLDLV